MSLLHTDLDIQAVSFNFYPGGMAIVGTVSWQLIAGNFNVLIHMSRAVGQKVRDLEFEVEGWQAGSPDNDVAFKASDWPGPRIEDALAPFVRDPHALPLDVSLLRDHVLDWDRKIEAHLGRWVSDPAKYATPGKQSEYYQQVRRELVEAGLR